MKSDVIVIGAGLNGLAVALSLGGLKLRRPLSVLLVDERGRNDAGPPDQRGTAITRASQAMLTSLGVWQELVSLAQDMRFVEVTDSDDPANRPGILSFANEQGHAATASIVENSYLLAALRAAVDASPLITLHEQHKVTEISFGPGLAVVTFADGSKTRTSLVVGADGRNSPTRIAAGISVASKDYGQSAISFSFSHELAHNSRAFEHFTPEGVFAVLPLTGNRSSIVWTDTTAEAVRLSALPDETFTEVFQEKLGLELGQVAQIGPRSCHPLSLQTANASTGPRLALVGDAAHVIHPLAGLGLNLGFKDAAALADCVVDAAAIGQDIGGMSVLEAFASLRRFDTLSTTWFTDATNQLFSSKNPGLKTLRDTGLSLVNKSEPLKTFLMKQAAGTSPNAPRLMRGLLP